MVCFFGYYAIPALYLAEITGPALIDPLRYVDGWSYGAVGSLIAVVIALELVKWSRIAPGKFSLFKPVSFKNYKYLFLVIVISALLNGVLANLIVSQVNSSIIVDVSTVFRFTIGDLIGACTLVAALWIIFTTLVDTRLIVSPEEE